VTALFVLLVVYQLKHFLADYPLQRSWMLGKFKPGWDFVWPLAAHAGVHGVFTYIIARCYGADVWPALVMSVFDFGVHFVMDRLKASPKYLGRWKPLTAAEWLAAHKEVAAGVLRVRYGHEPEHSPAARLRANTLFWYALGLDQMVHHLTHYAIIGYLVAFC
jgi:hypothetical protein